jgi:hypothetical protein
MIFWIVIAAIAAFMFGYHILGGILLTVAFLFPGNSKEDK